MKKVLWIFLGAFFFMGMPFWVSAQEEKQVIENELEIIAEVDIFDSSIVTQDGHNFVVDFTLNNGKGAQSDIRYSANLIKVYSEEEMLPVYFEVYDDSVTLAENSKVYKKIAINIPSYIDGEYELWLMAENADGLPLGVNFVGKVKLESSNPQHIEIDKSTCKFFIEGKKGEYYLSQGVDVGLSEELKLSCMAESLFDKDMEAEILIDTFRRTIYGEKTESDKNLSKISFKAKEKKEIVLTIPKPQEPQAYSALLSLKIDDNKISNIIEAHYIIQGESASIANLQLDKSQYVKGEKALVSFVWALAADAFPESRSGKMVEDSAFYSLSIKNSNQKDCASPINHQILKRDGVTSKTTLDITEDCLQPMVAVAIEDKSGKVLAKKEYNFTPDKGNKNVEEKVVENKTAVREFNFRSIALIIFGIITIIIIAIIVIKVIRGNSVRLLIFLVLGGSIFMVNNAKALTVSGTDGWTSSYSCAFGLNNSSYSPGSTITASVSQCKIVACLNSMRLRAYIAGNLKYSGSVSDGNGGNKITTRLYWAGPAYQYLTAPSTCGSRTVGVQVQFDHYSSSGWKYYSASGNLGYSVVGCCTPSCACAANTYIGSTCPNGCGGTCPGTKPLPINGACGPAATIYAASATAYSGALCSSGAASTTPTFPSYGGSSTWYCAGINGGVNSGTCTASRKLLAPVVDLMMKTSNMSSYSNGPISVNRDTEKLNISWNGGGATNCTKNGVNWGTGALTPTTGVTPSTSPINPAQTGPYPRSDVYTLDCWNSNGNTALDSNHASDNVTVNIACTPGDVWSGCPKECGLDSEVESGTRVYANCTTSNLGTRNCNYDPCPAASEWTEVKP